MKCLMLFLSLLMLTSCGVVATEEPFLIEGEWIGFEVNKESTMMPHMFPIYSTQYSTSFTLQEEGIITTTHQVTGIWDGRLPDEGNHVQVESEGSCWTTTITDLETGTIYTSTKKLYQ